MPGRVAAWGSVIVLLVLVAGAGFLSAFTAPSSRENAPKGDDAFSGRAPGNPTMTRPGCEVASGPQGRSVRAPLQSPSPSLTPWPERVVVSVGAQLPYPYTIIGTTGATASFLSSVSSDNSGPFVLGRIDLTDGVTTEGPVFPFSSLAFAQGFLWVLGTTRAGGHLGVPELCQVDPQTLQLIRQVQLPTPWPWTGAPYTGPVMSSGPDDTVWIGAGGMLWRLKVSSGKVVSTVRLAKGQVVALSTDDGDLHMYLSLVGSFSYEGSQQRTHIEELDPGTGRVLAGTHGDEFVEVAKTPPSVIATPAGVWASFRSGGARTTVILNERNLDEPFPPASDEPNIYEWNRGTTLLYASDAIWADTLSLRGSVIWSCLDPSSGRVRASGMLPASNGSDAVEFIAASSSTRTLYGFSGSGVVAVSPPQTCWR